MIFYTLSISPFIFPQFLIFDSWMVVDDDDDGRGGDVDWIGCNGMMGEHELREQRTNSACHFCHVIFQMIPRILPATTCVYINISLDGYLKRQA